MVVSDSEMLSQGEVESPLASDQQQEQATNLALSSLGRQCSIYSLTLDEFQNTLCEGGKNFGSMNMDEFLNSIWTAEENQAQATNAAVLSTTSQADTTQLSLTQPNAATSQKGMITKQPSLPRQGSLTLPGPLSRKTVEEVWAEIHKAQQEQPQNNDNINNVQNPGSSQRQRQITFGEMTLEDFLVRAGVVREQGQPPVLPQPPYGSFYANSNNAIIGSGGFVPRPVMSLGGGNVAGYQAGEASAGVYPSSMKRSGGGYAAHAQQPSAACFAGRIGNGVSGGGYGQVGGLGLGSPVSPVSPDGANQYGMRGSGGRKRIIDGPIEKVVERRQRRMIKNRESAARSRARKQAYTVELEAELNQFKEENAHLKQALAEAQREQKQQFDEIKSKAASRVPPKANETTRMLRRSFSCPY